VTEPRDLRSPAGQVGAKPSAPKKRYRKPCFKHEKIFETMALACGKLSPTQGQCHFNRKLS
jgi:hypothetical protein